MENKEIYMTPKEKAEYLLAQYIHLMPNTILHLHKQCALIAIDEIINNCTLSWNWYKKQGYLGVRDELKTDYWQEVKQEIKQL